MLDRILQLKFPIFSNSVHFFIAISLVIPCQPLNIKKKKKKIQADKKLLHCFLPLIYRKLIL